MRLLCVSVTSQVFPLALYVIKCKIFLLSPSVGRHDRRDQRLLRTKWWNRWSRRPSTGTRGGRQNWWTQRTGVYYLYRWRWSGSVGGGNVRSSTDKEWFRVGLVQVAVRGINRTRTAEITTSGVSRVSRGRGKVDGRKKGCGRSTPSTK